MYRYTLHNRATGMLYHIFATIYRCSIVAAAAAERESWMDAVPPAFLLSPLTLFFASPPAYPSRGAARHAARLRDATAPRRRPKAGGTAGRV